MNTESYHSVIEACQQCASLATQCEAACLTDDQVKRLARCIALTHQCASICNLTAEYLSAGSEFAPDICVLCADVCEACADECSKYNMHLCHECEQACLKCTEICRESWHMLTI